MLNMLAVASPYVSSTLSSSTDTITVGTAGTFNADMNIDISEALNAALKTSPAAHSIKVVFNPGDYGLLSPILLPSNSAVIGNNAELNFLADADGNYTGGAMIANAGSYYLNNNVYFLNSDGTYSEVPYNGALTARVPPSGYGAIQVNTNISVTGLTFYENDSLNPQGVNSGGNGFGTMFTNCTDINISNNAYIGGNDANGFINVNNGVIANNVAIGQIYSFDNWNGTSNITMIDNQVWQNSVGDDTASAGFQINSTPNGDTATSDPGYAGTATNDAVIDNSIAGNTNQNPVIAKPLLDHGNSTIGQIYINGNIDTSLAGDDLGYFAQGPISAISMTNNVITGADLSGTTGFFGAIPGATTVSGYNSSIASAQISGNLIYGASVAASNSTLVDNYGVSSQTLDNAAVAVTDFATSKSSTQSQILQGSVGGSMAANVVAPTLWVSVPDMVQMATNVQALSNIVAIDNVQSATLNVTVSAQFGAVSSPGAAAGGAVTFSGSLAAINQDLATLVYTASSLYPNFDDAIKITATDSAGYQSTSFIPVLVDSLSPTISGVVTIAAGFIAPSQAYPTLSSLPGATPPSLSGNILVAASGNDALGMTSVTSMAFLGAGNDTVYGGSLAEYIAAGTGTSVVSLNGGGNVTFVGAAGLATVSALSGNDLIEAGAGALSVTGGASPLTLLGGMGTLSYQDSAGTGNIFLTTLPSGGGNLNLQLGAGNNTILAYSGNDTITSENSTVGTNSILLGAGNDMVNSNGADKIAPGSANDTVNSNGTGMISLGSGSDVVNSSGADVIYAGSGLDTVNFGSTTTDTIIGGGKTVTITYNGHVATLPGSVYAAISGSYKTQLYNGALTLSAGHSSIDTQLYLSVTDNVGHNVLTVGAASSLNTAAGNDTIIVTGLVTNDSLSGANGANIIDVSANGSYNGSSTSFVSTKNVVNLNGNGEADLYAADQDTINVNGANNTLILNPNSQLPDTQAQSTSPAGSCLINVNGSSTALIESAGNSITGGDGATLYVSAGNNTLTGSNLNAQIGGGPGDKLVLTGADTLVSASPYSYQTGNSSMTVQNQMTVQAGQFTMGGLDVLDQTSGAAAISLFGGNMVTLNGANDSISVSDQIYGGNAITNNGANNVMNIANFAYAATTITANAGTLVNETDNTGAMIGEPNNNSGESLVFIAASGTASTILGASSNAAITLFGGQSSANIAYGGRAGGNSLNGGAGGGDYFKAGGAGDILIGGAKGNNTLIAAGGAETLVGAGLGNDAFSIGGGGVDLIQNFTGSLTVNAALTVASEATVSGSLVVSLSDKTTITFAGITKLTRTGNVFAAS